MTKEERKKYEFLQSLSVLSEEQIYEYDKLDKKEGCMYNATCKDCDVPYGLCSRGDRY